MPAEFENTSKNRRPDAVTYDYLTAFSLGPRAIQDPTEGVIAYVWRARYIGGQVLLSREEGEEWGVEVSILTIADGLAEPEEIDLAFTQNGNAVLCVQRPTGIGGEKEVWIHYFDAQSQADVFQNFGEGRNPRAVIDQPANLPDSDVQVFYVSDTLASVVHRQQRDNYATEYVIAAADENTFVQEAVIREDQRVELILAIRDVEAGRYTLGSIVSKLYPLSFGEEFAVRHTTTDVVLRLIIIESEADEEQFEVRHATSGLVLRDLIIETSLEESFEPRHITSGLELRALIIEVAMDEESFGPRHTTASLSWVDIIPADMLEESFGPRHETAALALDPI